MESSFSSYDVDDIESSLLYKNTYDSAVTNYDDYVRHYGTDGANVHFNKIINETKDEFIDFLLSRETSYLAMKNSRDGLEEKIKNSGGLTK